MRKIDNKNDLVNVLKALRAAQHETRRVFIGNTRLRRKQDAQHTAPNSTDTSTEASKIHTHKRRQQDIPGDTLGCCHCAQVSRTTRSSLLRFGTQQRQRRERETAARSHTITDSTAPVSLRCHNTTALVENMATLCFNALF